MKRVLFVSGIVAMAALMIPASSLGANRFGAKLLSSSTGNVLQPSNSVPKHACTNAPTPPSCTRVMVGSGTGFVDNHLTSPVTGTIKKIKLVAGAPGTLHFQLARVQNLAGNHGDAKIVREYAPAINYAGNGFDTGNPNQIEVFPVNLHVDAGDYIAIRDKRSAVLRCDSGGTRQLLFTPKLLVGGGFTGSSDNDGCTLMIQAILG